MLEPSSIRRSLEKYIQGRIAEIALELKSEHINAKKVWGCENHIDFLYGYYVGKIEEGALRYLLKATRASAGGFVDTFEIRGIIEMHKDELLDIIKASFR